MSASIQPVIVTADIDRLSEFYQQVLGATVQSRMPPDGELFYLQLRLGDADLGLVSNANAPAAPGPILLSIEVDDVDALLGLIRDRGGDASEPNDMPWGQRVAHVKDPDGNLVNLTRAI